MIYILIFILIFIFGILEYLKLQPVFNNIFWIFIFTILVLLAGLRYDTGLDYWEYHRIYGDAHFLLPHNLDGVEPLFGLYMKLCTILNFETFIFFTAFITLSIRFFGFKKLSPYPFLSLLIYYGKVYLFSEMGQIRQGMAMAILVFTIPYIVEKKIWKFTLVVLISTLIHSSAILFFLAYFARNISFSPTKYYLILVIFIPFIFFDSTIIFDKLFIFLPLMLKQKFIFYSKFLDAEKTIGMNFTFLLKLFTLSFFLFHLKFIKNSPLHLTLFNIYFFSILFFLLFNRFPQIGIRGSSYFSQVDIFLFPIILSYYSRAYINLIFVIIIGAYSGNGTLKALSGFSNLLYNPYYTIFEKNKLSVKRSLFILTK